MSLVRGGGGAPKIPPGGSGACCTSVKPNDPDTRVEDMVDTVIDPLLPLWTAPAFHGASVGDCKLAVYPSRLGPMGCPRTRAR